MKIVVIGGTGLVGSKVVQKLIGLGHNAVAASPRLGVNSVTGEGLAHCLDGSQVVIDTSNAPAFDDQSVMDFFETSGMNIHQGEIDAHVRHHIALSIVGADRLQASGYFRAKLAQERLVQASFVPYTVVRATQFFEFIRPIAGLATLGGEVRLPPVPFRPISAEDVATALVAAALAPPTNTLIEVAGPQTFTLDDAIRQVLKFDKDPRTVVTDPNAFYFGVAISGDMLVPAGDAHLSEITLKSWLHDVSRPLS